MTRVNHRLERLRSAFGDADRDEPPSPQAQKLYRRRAALLESLSPEHRQLVEEIDRAYNESW